MKTNSGDVVARRVAGACVAVGTCWVVTLFATFKGASKDGGGSIRLLWVLLLLALIANVYASLLGRALGRPLKDPRRAWSNCLVLSLIWLGVLQPWSIHGDDVARIVALVAAVVSLILAAVGLSREHSSQHPSGAV
jgi:hypothetical protein